MNATQFNARQLLSFIVELSVARIKLRRLKVNDSIRV